MTAPALLPWPNPRWKENPYQVVVYQGLRRNGIRVRRTPPLFSMLPYLPGYDWLHLNWPETLFADSDPARRAVQFSRFLGRVGRLKKRGTKVLWTVHNEFPHEDADLDFHREVNTRICELADLIHVHFPQAGELLEREYRADPGTIHVMPHPHYGEYYGTRIPRAEARKMLRVDPESRVVLVFGYLRRYKGIDAAVESLLHAKDADLRLLVAGKPEDEAVEGLLSAAAEKDSRIILRLGHVPPSDVMPLFSAADAFLFPSRQFFTSGSLMLALTYGLPVIAAPRNHASLFSGTSFFRTWEPDTTECLTQILETLDEWLAGVQSDELEHVAKEYAAERITEGLSRRLRE